MGQPVRIYELAERMIRLAGYEPGEDIEIAVTGTRPGERLHEILFAREEPRTEIGIDGVMAAKPVFADRDRVDGWLQVLNPAIARATGSWRNGRSRRRSRSSSAGSRCPSLPRQRRKRVSRRTDRLPAQILQGLRARATSDPASRS